MYTYPQMRQRNLALRPVVVDIHGGGFNRGNFSADPENLVRENLVLVTVNYRLGILGEYYILWL